MAVSLKSQVSEATAALQFFRIACCFLTYYFYQLRMSSSKVWQDLKQSLTSQHGQVFDVVGREEELSALENFISGCIESDSGSSLYVAGAPGCGKSAVMHTILQRVNILLNIVFYFN